MAWSVGAGLDGKGVIVTGAAGGIGRAVATAFSTTGARVLAVDLDQAKVDEVVGGFEGTGHLGVAADLRDLATHQVLVDRARSELGDLYVLANLAAVLRRRGSVDEVTEDDWDFQHDVNLKAAFFLSRAAGAAMIEQGQGGRIDHVQLTGVVDRRLRWVGRLRRDQGRRHEHDPGARPDVRASSASRSTRWHPGRSTPRCS